MQVEYLFFGKKFVFSRVLTDSEMNLDENGLKALDCYLREEVYENHVPQKYTIDDTLEILRRHKDNAFNSDGLTALLQIKMMLMLSGQVKESNLVLAMIDSVDRWLNALYLRQFIYKQSIESGVYLENVDYSDIVAPCSFRDVQWVLSPEFQAIDSARIVNTDINYYLNLVF